MRQQSKPPAAMAIRVPSDDCAVEVDGETYYPHVGEWVEILPLRKVRDIRSLLTVMKANTEDPASLAVAFDGLGDFLNARVVRWNWTDEDGRALPQPGNGVLDELTLDEQRWLARQFQGVEETRKNSSSPSTASSTARARNRMRTG